MKKFYMKGGYGYVQIQYRLLELINEGEGDMGTVRDDEVEYKGRFIIPYKSLRDIREGILYFPLSPTIICSTLRTYCMGEIHGSFKKTLIQGR